MNFTYMLRCADDSLYTGWTTDLAGRLDAHNSGKGAKYTRSRLPVRLVYFEEFDTKEEAMKREAAIKKLTRAKKECLLKCFDASSLPAVCSPEQTLSSGKKGGVCNETHCGSNENDTEKREKI